MFDTYIHVRIWDVRTQDKIFEDDAFPIHISKWAVIYQLDKGIRFLHLFKGSPLTPLLVSFLFLSILLTPY